MLSADSLPVLFAKLRIMAVVIHVSFCFMIHAIAIFPQGWQKS